MAGIGDDIKEVFQELGSPVEVNQHFGSPVTEFVDPSTFESSDPYTRQTVMEISLPFDSTIQSGDIITLTDNGTHLLVVSLNFQRFDQDIVTKEAMIYRCNVLGTVSKFSRTRDSNYKLVEDWVPTSDEIPCLITGDISQYSVNMEEYGNFVGQQLSLHITGNVSVEKGNRFTTSDGVVFSITAVAPYRLNNVNICRIEEVKG